MNRGEDIIRNLNTRLTKGDKRWAKMLQASLILKLPLFWKSTKAQKERKETILQNAIISYY
jgi:hypothetical protein